MSVSEFDVLNSRIVACEACPRLREWCTQVATEKRKAFIDESYWGLPVPNFGDPNATGLIVGLAPAAHGANRTGRMFTGDRSGEWLYRSLHRAGIANQPIFERADDGLSLSGVMITAICHCAPPDNKPTPIEMTACRNHLEATWQLRPWRAVLCLGSIAWSQFHRAIRQKEMVKFGHGNTYKIADEVTIIGSYHPSQQNTFTGRLTEAMLDEVVTAFAAKVR